MTKSVASTFECHRQLRPRVDLGRGEPRTWQMGEQGWVAGKDWVLLMCGKCLQGWWMGYLHLLVLATERQSCRKQWLREHVFSVCSLNVDESVRFCAVFLPTTAQCRLVFACSHLHVLVCTSGTWDESNKFHFDASDITSCQMTVTSLSLLVWHISFVRDPHCLMPKTYSVIFLIYGHVGVHLAGFLSLFLLSYIFMLMLNVTLCGESLAQTGAHRHRIC